MGSTSILKHLLCDDDSLSSYFGGQIVSFDAVKRRMLLLERKSNRFIADHYYRLNQEKSFDGISSLADVLGKGLFQIADTHLKLRGNRIYVKQKKQNDWQELITQLPPLVIQAVFLQIKKPLEHKKTVAIIDYFNDFILPNARYTALPFPYIKQLENHIEQKNGLHDLHMHLSGSTETDIVWQDFLKAPDKIYKELRDGFKNSLVKEQFEQESHLTDPIKFRDLLLIARRIRNYMFVQLHPGTSDLNNSLSIESPEQLIIKTINVNAPFFDGFDNPFDDLIGDKEKSDNFPMAVECLMYVNIFQYLSVNPRGSVASMFHFYLLILGLANRLLVQQTHQYGFEQFQKHTVNELRSHSEKAYRNRFLQLHGNELRNINFLEGRFSPKESEVKTLLLLQNIRIGWGNLIENQKAVDPTKESPRLKLIAHFIKVKDKSQDWQIRHKDLRKSVWQKARVLAFMKDRNNNYIQEVIGIDAASSEFDAPPEVFAPSFRLLRSRGFKHFTYHAGEDYFHIISGLRAIYEAIDFTEMKKGDRIGHAVASGVDAKVWINNVGRMILIRQGEHLDNLLFTHYLITKEQIEPLHSTLKKIEHKILELSLNIYQKNYPVEILLEAWKLRKYCPMLLLSDNKDSAEPYSVYNDFEWCEIENQIPNRKNDMRFEILQKYHDINHRKRYEEIIEIDPLAIVNLNAINKLQLALLKYMNKKGIVIETLPTSNVRIGQHHDFKTYHLWNWVKWKVEGNPIPPIVVGTDDAGIFATNIYNEFANIYCHLTWHHKMAKGKAMALILELDKNASIYKFD